MVDYNKNKPVNKEQIVRMQKYIASLSFHRKKVNKVEPTIWWIKHEI